MARVLGIAQDAGVPQANCRCTRCEAAHRDPARRRHAASLAMLDSVSRQTFLIDATPDLVPQLAALASDPDLPLAPGRSPLAGVLLTHAHVGHYAGLIHFGREAMATQELPLWATERMARFLESNGPWSQLVTLKHVRLEPVVPGRAVELTPRLRATALRVPHRDELSDTVAWVIEGPKKRLLWLPDIDKWERWMLPLEAVLEQVDYAFLDGTFFSADEVPGRDLAEIPHPLVSETRDRLRGRPRHSRVFLIHLNHTNPLLDLDGKAREALARDGIEVASEGLRLEL